MTAPALLLLLAQDEPASAAVHTVLVESLAGEPQWLCCEACGKPGRDVRQRGGHVLDETGSATCDVCDTAALAAAFDAVDPPRARDLLAVAYEHAVAEMRLDVERGAA